MGIDPKLIEALSVVLGRLYKKQDLEPLMLTLTGDGLYEAWVDDGMAARHTIFQLLQAVNQAGIGERVLAEMLARRSHSAELRALVAQAAPAALSPPTNEKMGLSLQRGGEAVASPTGDAFAPGLQRNVRPNLAKLDLQVWIDRLVQVRNRVCRIEIGSRAGGTGFLVGPQAVLTNWHVLDKAAAAGKLAELRCRFDYIRLSDGTRQSGVTVALDAEGIAVSSPFSPAEMTATPDTPEPGPGELDFALLHLAEAAGSHPVADGTRGWVTLPAGGFPLEADAPLLIVQHPDGAPMKLAMDTQAVIGPNSNGTRIRYRTNTDNGSSGSPCFSMDWDPVLLHHFGDPAWGEPQFNQGVPLGLIRAHIESVGRAALLGG